MNRKLRRTALTLTVAFLLGLTTLYPFLLYTDNGFVKKWRNIYIETAMSTMSHQWLAEWFIPQAIIDDVLSSRYLSDEKQLDAETNWSTITLNSKKPDSEEPDAEVNEAEAFFEKFYEIDRATFESYADTHPELLENGYEGIDLDLCEDGESDILTTEGDPILAINAEHDIMIVGVRRSDWVGKMAVVKDSSRVHVGVSESIGSIGQNINVIAERYDAILAVNASGFQDPEGMGNGGVPYGFVKTYGEIKHRAEGHSNWKIVGYDEENRLQIGKFKDTDFLRDAIEFHPSLIINGENMIEGTGGWGLNPRTFIGQKQDLTTLIVVIDGRQPGYSPFGAALNECSELMQQYGAYQAQNLDGGSSSVMYYNGNVITKPSNKVKNGVGRKIPDVFMVT